LEYEKAIELNKEILIYLIDEKNALVNTQYIDFGEAHEKLENFKQLLKEKHTIDTFRAPEDWKDKLGNRLNDLLSRKEEEGYSDDDDYSRNTLEKFHLFPKKYGDREIRLKIKFDGKGFPASKGICKAFGLRFGETLGIPIEIIEPKIENNRITELFLDGKDSDFYFNNKETDELEILGRLLFLDERIGKMEAAFFDEEYTVSMLNPDYDPSRPDYSSVFFRGTQYLELSPSKYITETKIIEGECKAIILFVKWYQ